MSVRRVKNVDMSWFERLQDDTNGRSSTVGAPGQVPAADPSAIGTAASAATPALAAAVEPVAPSSPAPAADYFAARVASPARPAVSVRLNTATSASQTVPAPVASPAPIRSSDADFALAISAAFAPKPKLTSAPVQLAPPLAACEPEPELIHDILDLGCAESPEENLRAHEAAEPSSPATQAATTGADWHPSEFPRIASPAPGQTSAFATPEPRAPIVTARPAHRPEATRAPAPATSGIDRLGSFVDTLASASISAPRSKVGQLPSRSLALTVCIFSMGIGLASIGGLWDSLNASGSTTAAATEMPPATVIQTFDPVKSEQREFSAPTGAPVRQASVLNVSVTGPSTADDGLVAAAHHDTPTVPIPSPVVQRIRNVAIEDRAPVPVQVQPRPVAVANLNTRVAPPATTGRSGPNATAERASTPASRPKLILDLTVAADETARVAFPLQIEGFDTAAAGGYLLIHGLPEHATMSRGKLVDRGQWRTPAAGARDLVLSLPPLTPGDFEVLLELRSADGALVTSGLSVVRVVPRPRSMTTTAMAAPDASAVGGARRQVSDVAPIAMTPSAPAPGGPVPTSGGTIGPEAGTEGPDTALAAPIRQKTPVPLRTARAFGPLSGLGGPGRPGGPPVGTGPARTPDRGFGVFDQRKGI